MKTNCRLCNKNKPLVNSHIIPKFVYRWLKESTDNGALRLGSEPNLRVQDGHKDYLLCEDCEKLFNSWETIVANNVFYPLVKDKNQKIMYEDWFLKFCVSVSWRILMFLREQNHISSLSSIQLENLEKASEKWKEFILGSEPHPARYEQHFLPIGDIQGSQNVSMPTNINRYISLTVDMDIIVYKSEIYIYAKLGPLLLIGIVCSSNLKQWVGTKVHVRDGIIKPQEYSIPSLVGNYIMDRSELVLEIQNKMSDKQVKISSDALIQHLNTMPNSTAFLSVKQDVTLFGQKAFQKDV